MFQYFFYTYIGITFLIIFKGYQYFYKINDDQNDQNDNEFKYSLFDDEETNDLNKLLLYERNEKLNTKNDNNKQTQVRVKIHNFKENVNENIDKMFSSIKNIYRNNYNKKGYINPNIDNEIKPKTSKYEYNEDIENKLSYIQNDLTGSVYSNDLNSTINTEDLNISNATELQDIKIQDSQISENNINSKLFHSVVSE
tara:strand:- start:89 stop:679 length:591 start_codon:yes stop_codon:yes gene_type:complete